MTLRVCEIMCVFSEKTVSISHDILTFLKVSTIDLQSQMF